MLDYCLVRQPVFAAEGTVLGYEIRFRDSDDGRHAFNQSFLSGTFDMVRGGLPAFLVCTRTQLLENAFQIVNPKHAILVLPPYLVADDKVVGAVKRFCASGGSIALDDITEEEAASEALIPYASWVRVDVRCEDAVAIGRVCDRVSSVGVAQSARLVADHVCEARQYLLAKQLGFDAFQGAFLSRPEPLTSTDLRQETEPAAGAGVDPASVGEY